MRYVIASALVAFVTLWVLGTMDVFKAYWQSLQEIDAEKRRREER